MPVHERKSKRVVRSLTTCRSRSSLQWLTRAQQVGLGTELQSQRTAGWIWLQAVVVEIHSWHRFENFLSLMIVQSLSSNCRIKV
jgi:hypothetical protein